MSKKYLTIVGNRPQLIKFDKELPQVLVYTGQHYDKLMKDVFFQGLKLPKPDYDLKETKLGAMTDKIVKVIEKEKPSHVIVYGDTRSTLAGAMAALYTNTPIIHIEAGCRSFNRSMPEERIREIVDKMAVIHFTPSFACKEFLERDINNNAVYNVGATQIDTMYETFPTVKPKDAYKYRVATIHRESNTTKANLEEIFKGMATSKLPIRLYTHPRTIDVINKYNIKVPKQVKLKAPLPYKKMINELAFAERVITDSGGLQVEAFFLKTPCITIRYETEWVETVESGWNILCGPDAGKIEELLKKERWRGKGNMYVYGGGDSKRKIRMILNNL